MTRAMFCVLAFSLTFALLGQATEALPRSDVSPDEIIKALSPKPRTRGLTRNLKIEPARIDLTVQFDFDSANLREESKPQLQSLAQALKNEALVRLRFQIEGHTDAQGSASYNQTLSELRARSVLAYLASQGVQEERLQARGKGFTELLDPSRPLAPANRRVRILTLD